MSDSKNPEESIPREKVERLAENLRNAAEDLIDQLESSELRVEQILEVTRFMARSARRISRRANWPAAAAKRAADDEGNSRSRPKGRGDEARGRGGPSRGGGRPNDGGRPNGGGGHGQRSDRGPSSGDRSRSDSSGRGRR